MRCSTSSDGWYATSDPPVGTGDWSSVDIRQDFVDKAIELAELVPGAQAEGDALDAGALENAKVFDALVGTAEGAPGLNALPGEVG
jgi:hypothetical protein